MAEAILRTRWAEAGASGLVVSSMGIHGVEKQPATEFAIKVCESHGVNLSKFISRPLVHEELRESDLIFVMETFQKNFLKLFFPMLDDRVFLLRAWPQQKVSKRLDIKDPMGGKMKKYERAFKELSAEIDRILPLLTQQYTS
jgi:protein-tyrosine-phosphatase